MVVFSCLARFSHLSQLFKANLSKSLLEKDSMFRQAIRKMSGTGHERIMDITPSRFQYARFKDDLHFYLSLGIIPLSLIVFYVNVFIGPAELTEIPEGYEPKAWEYYSHPIQRFFVKYFLEDPQIIYERHLHHLNEEMESIKWRQKTKKVLNLMAERNDYKAWHFIPSSQGRYYRYGRKIQDDIDESRGYR